MDQNDIFRLLLIVLLLANRQLSQTSDDADDESFSYTSINDLLIFAMLLGGFGDNDTNKGTTF